MYFICCLLFNCKQQRKKKKKVQRIVEDTKLALKLLKMNLWIKIKEVNKMVCIVLCKYISETSKKFLLEKLLNLV